MYVKRILSALLLCTVLWICACSEPTEALTVEMHDYYQVHDPILVSVIMPASYDVSELIFQINGTIYTAQSLPNREDPKFILIAEDGNQTAYLIVNGFWEEASSIVLQFLPNASGEVPGPEDVWFGETNAFLPLFAWFEKATTSN